MEIDVFLRDFKLSTLVVNGPCELEKDEIVILLNATYGQWSWDRYEVK